MLRNTRRSRSDTFARRADAAGVLGGLKRQTAAASPSSRRPCATEPALGAAADVVSLDRRGSPCTLRSTVMTRSSSSSRSTSEHRTRTRSIATRPHGSNRARPRPSLVGPPRRSERGSVFSFVVYRSRTAGLACVEPLVAELSWAAWCGRIPGRRVVGRRRLGLVGCRSTRRARRESVGCREAAGSGCRVGGTGSGWLRR